MKISVVGAGHVGLVTGVCFAEIGHDVLCIDNDVAKVSAFSEGRSTFYEPHVNELLRSNLEQGRLAFSAALADGVAHSDAIFVCVGTPPLPEGEADLSAVERVARQIALLSQSYKLVIEKSTVPVLTGQRIARTMQIYRGERGGDFDVASNPEFLAEGTAVTDFLFPDRIVIGVESERAERMFREIYQPLLDQTFAWRPPEPVRREAPPVLLVTDRNSAEIIKHASNSFLATKISYINMVADLCEEAGADISLVAEGMGLDRRIGAQFLRAGVGFGGFCFPKDLQAFVRIAEKSGCDFSLLREVERVNVKRIERFVHKVKNELWVIRGKRIAVWGLAFKARTDDMRFSPAGAIIERLQAEGAAVCAYDPEAMEEAKKLLPDIDYASSAAEAAHDAEAILLLTEWPQFKDEDFAAIRKTMLRPLMIDGRNLLDGETLRGLGFEYLSIGRP